LQKIFGCNEKVTTFALPLLEMMIREFRLGNKNKNRFGYRAPYSSVGIKIKK
jgi:hypothetical protein